MSLFSRRPGPGRHQQRKVGLHLLSWRGVSFPTCLRGGQSAVMYQALAEAGRVDLRL